MYNTRTGGRANQRYGNQTPTNTNYSQQNQSYTQPAYSTPTSYGGNKANYQQNQQTGQSPATGKVTQAAAKAAPTPVVQQQPQVPVTPQQAPPPPPVQQTPTAPAKETQPKQEENNDNSMDTSEDTPNTGKTPKFRPWNKRDVEDIEENRATVPDFSPLLPILFEKKMPISLLEGSSGLNKLKKGIPGKVSRKIRKQRQNARLRNLLAPKNAMMVLHELHPELKMVISEQVNAANQTAYTVEIEIEKKVYRGHGMSKMAAKQSAAENALKAVVLEKAEKSKIKISPDSTLVSELPESQDVQMKEEGAAGAGTGEAGDAAKKKFVGDDVPWGSLASFALFKLFSEWQQQGFQLPPSGLPPVFQKTVKKVPPEDANKKHPVQLLNQIRPGSQYSETREGQLPHLTFKFTVVIDGNTYEGVGTNKKDAKKECAKRALEALGVKYD